MIRTRIGICPALGLLLFATPTLANNFVGGGVNFMPPPPAPASISWQLCTESSNCLTYALPSVTLSQNPLVHEVTAMNAADFGINWADWSAAVIDPAYNRLDVTFGGVTKTAPFENNFEVFELDRLRFILSGFDGLSQISSAGFQATDIIVPEPATWLMACTIGLHLFARCRSRRVP